VGIGIFKYNLVFLVFMKIKEDMCLVNFLVNREMWEMFKETTEAQGFNRSKILRGMIDLYLKKGNE
tara:strand:+ start:278 stop:475 length:198 start_codon:yes stop_codon:yes gene_type:complete